MLDCQDTKMGNHRIAVATDDLSSAMMWSFVLSIFRMFTSVA